MPLTPNNREEHWLQGMVDGQTTLNPNKRREYWYKEIVDAIGSGGGGGTGGGALVVNATTGTLDKTWNEINDATFAVLKTTPPMGGTKILYITSILPGDEEYTYDIYAVNCDGGEMSSLLYSTSSADGYPVFQEG